MEAASGNVNTAIKHWKVAACAGSQDSVDRLMNAFKNNHFPKEELALVLRAFQASNDEVKSEARDKAALWMAELDAKAVLERVVLPEARIRQEMACGDFTVETLHR